MIREIELYLTIHQASYPENYHKYISELTLIPENEIKGYVILKRAVDARKNPVSYYFKFRVYINEIPPGETPRVKYWKSDGARTVHIIGCGPAGLFAALECIKNGVRPIVYERGKPVSERKKDIALLTSAHTINADSNYCFGEGGAGTFSDGKLYTRSKKKGDVSEVLNTFVAHGASEEILFDAQPHIGTDILPRIITSMRNTIMEYGGEVRFNSKLTGIEVVKGKLKSIVINQLENIPVADLILATGHSARDVYTLLHNQGILLEPKPFALGVRVEHPQELINTIQYHGKNYNKLLPPATYKLVEQVNGRGVFSFCMCPGGIIVPAATDSGQVVVNGMSNARRNSPFANAGFVVQVNPEDVLSFKDAGPLFLLSFQKSLEEACCINSEKPLTVPAQRMTDFVNNKLSVSLPPTSYRPGVQSTMLSELLPPFITEGLRKAFVLSDSKMKGFYTQDAVLLATESRTSSPVRIPRHHITYEHVQVSGLYPCGEGAGYAGGITSSALDGINCVKAILKS